MVRTHLYRAIWRWHFYAGICVLPLVLALALSGLAMLASTPLDRYLHSELLSVAASGAPLAASEQVAAVADAYPNADVITYFGGLAADESARITIMSTHVAAGHEATHRDAGLVTVFVDPYTGDVLGELDETRTVYAWAKKVHGTLLLGTAGDYIIEIGAGFGVLMIVTGLYLWWPRDGRTARQVLLPAVTGTGRRRWRHLHAAAGVWSAPLLLFFFVSGLAWTPFWGGKLVQTWSSLPGEAFDAPLATATHESLGEGARRAVPWAVEQTPLPLSGSRRGAPGIASDGPIAVDDVVAYARAAGFERFRVHLPRGPHGVWTVASTTIGGDTQVLDGDHIVHLDADTGNVLADIRFDDYAPMGKLMAAGIPLHQADTGTANLLVNVVFCFGVIGMCVAALGAWWARRPGGARRLVPPPLPRDARVWRTAVGLMLTLSVAFPLVAVTIAVVIGLDLLLLRRVPALRLMFE
jgi:uncharacterized iron-regulated membrane protein